MAYKYRFALGDGDNGWIEFNLSPDPSEGAIAIGDTLTMTGRIYVSGYIDDGTVSGSKFNGKRIDLWINHLHEVTWKHALVGPGKTYTENVNVGKKIGSVTGNFANGKTTAFTLTTAISDWMGEGSTINPPGMVQTPVLPEDEPRGVQAWMDIIVYDGSGHGVWAELWGETEDGSTDYIAPYINLVQYHFAPSLVESKISRVKLDGGNYVAANDGIELMIPTLKIRFNALTNLAHVTRHFFEWPDVENGTEITAEIPVESLVNGYSEVQPTLFAGTTFPATMKANVYLHIGDMFENYVFMWVIPKSFANLNMAPYETGGIAFGGFSTATEDNPLFECHYPAKLYGTLDVSGAAAISGTAEITGATALKGGISNFGSSVQGGTITISSVADGSTKDGTVKFSKAFKSAPFVMISGYSSSTAASYGGLLFAIVSGSITASQFKIRVFNDSGSTKSPDIRWIAIGTM